MKAKVKKGKELLFMLGKSNNWNKLTHCMIINFLNKWTYQSFEQLKNYLIIHTTEGDIQIVFTGDIPKLQFEYYNKDQLIFKILDKVQ